MNKNIDKHKFQNNRNLDNNSNSNNKNENENKELKTDSVVMSRPKNSRIRSKFNTKTKSKEELEYLDVNDDFEIIIDDLYWYIPHPFNSSTNQYQYQYQYELYLKPVDKKRESELTDNIIIPHDQKSIILFLPLSDDEYRTISLSGPMCGIDIIQNIYNFYQDPFIQSKIDSEFWKSQLFFDRIESLSDKEWMLYTFQIEN